MKNRDVLILSLLFTVFTLFTGHAQVPEKDSLALVDLYHATDGDNWTYNANWLEGPVSTWGRITVTNNRVSHVYLIANNLSGTSLPASLGDLDSLVQLNLASNPHLSAVIPSEIGNLEKLTSLDINLCDMHGEIPAELGNLSSLEQLKLGSNRFTGAIPAELGNLSKLYYLNLGNNQLSGTIPAGFWHLDSLGWLKLADNDLEGVIPEDIAQWTRLEEILLSNNHFTAFPDVSALQMVFFLDLDGNRFTFEDLEPNVNVASHRFTIAPQDSVGEAHDDTVGTGHPYTMSVSVGGSANNYQWFRNGFALDGETDSSFTIESADEAHTGTYHCAVTNEIVTGLTIYSRPVHLEVIDYAAISDSLALVSLFEATGGEVSWSRKNNWLTAPLSSGWYGISLENNRVVEIDLSFNNLLDTLPDALALLDSLRILKLHQNNLSGPLPEGLWNLPNIEEMYLQGNSFQDSLPGQFDGARRLKRLYLSDNAFMGSMPAAFGALDSLEILELYDNDFSGSLPPELGNMDKIRYMDLHGNMFTGTLTATLYGLETLSTLDLSNNEFEGALPDELGLLTGLRTLRLTNNTFSGPIPESLYNLTGLTELSLSGNDLNDSLSVDIANLTSLEKLYITNAGLTGRIPGQIGSKETLQYLNLSNNNLEGPVPEEIGEHINLTQLSLNGNNLVGSLPASLGDLNFLTFLSVSGNELSGDFPIDLWSMTSLSTLDISDNNWSGPLPEGIGNLTNVAFLSIRRNRFDGAVPASVRNLRNLAYFYIDDNRFTDLPNLDTLTKVISIRAFDNRFTFEDIEPNIGVASFNFTYHPQDSIGKGLDTLLNESESLPLQVNVGGEHNLYQWECDGIDIEGATESTYEITSASVSDSGTYICRITNTVATDLTLYSRPFHVSIDIPFGLEEEVSGLPLSFDLQQNYPNPFNPVTRIRYQLPETEFVTISVFNTMGEMVQRLVNKRQEAGYYSVSFSGKNLASGIYYYRMEAGTHNFVRKMILVK